MTTPLPSELAQGTMNARVLCVGDRQTAADSTADALEQASDELTVQTTADPRAVPSLVADGIECVVSDYDLSGTNGRELLAEVREGHPDLPFILVTDTWSEELANRAISAGATDCLQKPSGTEQYGRIANRIENAVERYRSQRALAESQRRLSLFFDESPLGVIEWSSDFEVVRVNAAAEEILGYSEADLLGDSWERIVPADETSHVESVVDKLLGDSGGYTTINENVTASGERVICEWHNRIITDDDGTVRAAFSQFQDVTEREQSKRRLETLIDNLPGMVYRCRNERGWPMEFVGGECERLCGYSPREIESGVVSWGESIIHPDDQETAWETVQTALAEGRPFELTYRIRTRDGDVRWMWERGRLTGDSTETQKLEGFITDVTDRTEYERAIESLHDATRDLLAADSRDDIATVVAETATDLLDFPVAGVYFVDDSGAALTPVAWTAADDVSADPPPELGQDTVAWEVFEDGEPRFSDDPRTTREGSPPLVRELVVPLGQHGVLIAGTTDHRRFEERERRLTEVLCANAGAAIDRAIREETLREHERELERENERLDRFVDLVSHDLRNPLEAAQLRLELGREACDNEHLEVVERSHDRMETLLDDLLELARTGDSVAEVEPVNVEDLVKRCWSTIDTSVADLVVEDSFTVDADESRLAQLFENLIRNSIEHGGDDVTIRTGPLDGGFYVEDDGSGIPPEERDEIFQPGQSSADGTGFGLTIVREIAQAHGWSIRVTEGSEGGARFEITDAES